MRELHLFAGAGGGILGGMMLGHTPVGAVEIDPFARAVLQARQADGSLPDFPIYEDVRTFDGTAWRDRVDIIAGGFPCQDLSCAGKGAGIDGARSGLWWEMLRVVREARPRYVFLENVPAITGRGLDRVLGSLADLGFDAEWCVLSAADVGAPHLRKRWWCLARDTVGNDEISQSCVSEGPHAEPAGDGATVADACEKQAGMEECPGRRQNRACSSAPEPTVLRCGDRSLCSERPGADCADVPYAESCQDIGRGRGSMDGAESRGQGLDSAAGTSCPNVSDSDGRRCEQRQSIAAHTQRAGLERGCPAHTDTDGRRCEEQRQPQQPDMQCTPGDKLDRLREAGRRNRATECAAGSTQTEPGVGRAADGLAAWMDAGRRLHGSAWEKGWEDDCPRVITGKPANRTNRLKALGNGQVPQTAAAAFRILWQRLHT